MMFDSHCHPQFPEYDSDREAVIQRALDEGVLMIAVGTSLETSRTAIELARKYPGKIWATAGIHPTEQEVPGDELRRLAELPEVVAIGECGLDYHHLPDDPEEAEAAKTRQRENFIAQIELARSVAKPLVVHSRKAPKNSLRDSTGHAYTDILSILKEYARGLSGVVHFFQGTAQEAREFLDLGFFISFAGPITFADEYRGVVAAIPLNRILAETDAPYAAPLPHRGKRNEPIHVKFVIEKIAEIKEKPLEEIAAQTTKNAKALFCIG